MSHQDMDVAGRIRAQGRRLTPQREMILDAVCETGGHATPDDVYARVQARSPAVNRATVYRTLAFLVDVGIVTSTVDARGHLAYEMTGPEPHHHLVCQSCGAEVEIGHDLVARLLETIHDKHGFSVATATHLSLFGLCADCRE